MLLEYHKRQTATGYEFSFGNISHKQKAFFMFAFSIDVVRIMPTHNCGNRFNFNYLCLLQSIRGNQSLTFTFLCISIILKGVIYPVKGRKHKHCVQTSVSDKSY